MFLCSGKPTGLMGSAHVFYLVTFVVVSIGPQSILAQIQPNFSIQIYMEWKWNNQTEFMLRRTTFINNVFYIKFFYWIMQCPPRRALQAH